MAGAIADVGAFPQQVVLRGVGYGRGERHGAAGIPDTALQRAKLDIQDFTQVFLTQREQYGTSRRRQHHRPARPGPPTGRRCARRGCRRPPGLERPPGVSTVIEPDKCSATSGDLAVHPDRDGVDAEPGRARGEPVQPEAVAVALEHRHDAAELAQPARQHDPQRRRR